ncbi:response regulator [Sulfitobacter sp.]|uniref:response regulator n=1 Tax=Sulfitobacter sp. TaxID=1903071 RepID=UPI0030011E2F
MKILSVDDDPVILEILCQVLSEMDTHVMVSAASAQEALTILDQNDGPAFDCILLDIQMPSVDGTMLARHIRKTDGYDSTPIVMLTVMSEKRDIDAAFAAGATDYIFKPFDLIELRTRINVVEQLVQTRKKTFDAVAIYKASNTEVHLDPNDAFEVRDIENVISFDAMKNYVAQLSRNALFDSTVFAFTLRNATVHCENLSAHDFKTLIADVVEVISGRFSDRRVLIAYAGSSTFVCITGSGSRPNMAAMTDLANLHLNQASIMSGDGTDLNPRVSAGIAISLVWKSGEQIPSCIVTAQVSAEKAAAEHERLRYDFFQSEKIA